MPTDSSSFGLGSQSSQIAPGFEIVDVCPVCRAPFDPLPQRLFAGRWAIETCRGCGVGVTNPRPSRETIASYYPRQYYAHTPRSLSLGQRIRNRVKEVVGRYPDRSNVVANIGWYAVAPFLAPLINTRLPYLGRARRRLLDIGCGIGENLLWAQSLGWQVSGIEPNPQAVDIAWQRGLSDVRIGTLHSSEFHEGSFDLVTMFQVLEHVHDPVAELQKVHRLLASRGLLLVAVPNFLSMPRIVLDKLWNGLQPPLHLVHFTPNALRKVAELSRFDVQEIRVSNAMVSVFQNLRGLNAAINAWKRQDGPFSKLAMLSEIIRRIPKAVRQTIQGDVSVGDQLFAVFRKPS